MKLVIDITEEQFKACLCTLSSPFELSPVIESYCDMIANGIPLEKELEKIKEEIKDLDLGFFDEDYRAGVARGIMEFNKILNKHIKELKGE